MMNISAKTALALLLAMGVSQTRADAEGDAKERSAFEQAAAAKWREVFADDGTGAWEEKWFLDGEVGTVTNSPEGMTLIAGPEFKTDAHHMVLWTKQEFEGDLKIEYDFTRTDKERRCVTILYIQATSSGKGKFAKDIATWGNLRKVPAMSTYYDNMNTYHVSYAAFENSGKARCPASAAAAGRAGDLLSLHRGLWPQSGRITGACGSEGLPDAGAMNRLLQELAWQTVISYPLSGVREKPPAARVRPRSRQKRLPPRRRQRSGSGH